MADSIFFWGGGGILEVGHNVPICGKSQDPGPFCPEDASYLNFYCSDILW